MRASIHAIVTIIVTSLAPLGNAHSGQPFAFDSPLGIVSKVYHDYSFESVFDSHAPYPTLLDESTPILESYFAPALVKLIVADRQCASAHGWGYCKIDFMPIWASQDSSRISVNLSETSKAEEILATLTVPEPTPGVTSKIELVYVVTKTPRGWRIGDIRGNSWSLVATLSGK